MTTALERRITRHRGGAKLLESLAIAINGGWRILPGEAFHKKIRIGLRDGRSMIVKICCALGALDTTAGDFHEAAARNGWSLPRAWAFAQGFDSTGTQRLESEPEEGVRGSNPSHRRAFAMGRLVRRWVDRRQAVTGERR